MNGHWCHEDTSLTSQQSMKMPSITSGPSLTWARAIWRQMIHWLGAPLGPINVVSDMIFSNDTYTLDLLGQYKELFDLSVCKLVFPGKIMHLLSHNCWSSSWWQNMYWGKNQIPLFSLSMNDMNKCSKSNETTFDKGPSLMHVNYVVIVESLTYVWAEYFFSLKIGSILVSNFSDHLAFDFIS